MGHHGAPWPHPTGTTLPEKAQPRPSPPSPIFDDFGDDPMRCSGVLPMGLALTQSGSLGCALECTGHPKQEWQAGRSTRDPHLQCHGETLPLEPSPDVHCCPHSVHGPPATGGEGEAPHQCPVCVPPGEGMVPAGALSKRRHRETRQREGWFSRVALAVRCRHAFPGDAGHRHSGGSSAASKCPGVPREPMLR